MLLIVRLYAFARKFNIFFKSIDLSLRLLNVIVDKMYFIVHIRNSHRLIRKPVQAYPAAFNMSTRTLQWELLYFNVSDDLLHAVST